MERAPGTPRRAWLGWAGVGLIAAITAAAVGARADGEPGYVPTLHEYIPPPLGASTAVIDPASVRPDRAGVFGADPGAGQNPAGFQRGGKILPRPDADAPRADAEPVHGRADFGADRQTETRPDRQTGPDGRLSYVEVFNPSVVPFKRMTAFDAARDDYTLHVFDTSLQDLPVGAEPAAGRDLFWASLAIELEPGRDVPIPSVAPDMRILSYEIEPPTQVAFSRDGADNYFVRSDEAGASGSFRLVFLADADARYFAPKIAAGIDLAAIAPRRVRPLPASIRPVAERALRRLGVHRRMTVKQAVDALAYYFRQFEAKPPPPASGDLYWDLLSSQAGVCRHRAFAFAITATALGLPARYVANEAHAWAEVWVPHGGGDGGWIRVDLGGAALQLDVSNAGDKTMYQPRGRDELPEPPEYANNYTRLEGDIRGLSPEQIAEARTPLPEPSADAPATAWPAGADPPDVRTIGPGSSLPELPSSAYAGKLRTAVTLGDAELEGYRGEAIVVEGRLADAAELGVSGRSVDIYAAPAGYQGEYARLVGRAVTGEDGRFAARVRIPNDLELGDYELYAAFAGDDAFAPAVSD